MVAKARWQESQRETPSRPSRASGAKTGRWKTGKAESGSGVTVFRVFLGLFALGAVLTLAVMLVLYLYPLAPPRFVPIHASYNAGLLPPNAFAHRDIQSLAEQTEVLDVNKANLSPLTGEALRSQLQNLPDYPAWQRWFRWEKNTLLVYINACGVNLWDPTREEERAYLLGSDFEIPIQSGPPEQFGAVPLSDVLSAITDCNAEQKLIVFDVTCMQHHWPLGMFRNRFTELAEVELNQLPEEKQRGVFAFFSTSPGEDKQLDQAVGLSIFGRYFLEGLTGAADLPDNGGNADGRIHLNELEQYVSSHVADWTSSHRGVAQHPRFVSFDQDLSQVALVALPTSAKIFAAIPLTDDPKRQDVVGQLEQAWQNYYKLAAAPLPACVYAPRLWRYVQDTLLRAESFLLAEELVAAAQEAENAIARLKAVEESREQLAIQGQGFSLAMEEFLQDTREVSATPAASNILTPMPTPVSAESHAFEIFDAVVRDLNQGRSVSAAMARLSGLDLSSLTVPVEIHLLLMANKYLLEPTNLPNEDVLEDRARRLIRLTVEAEKTATPTNYLGPAATPWVKTRLERADDQRRWRGDSLFAVSGNRVNTQPDAQIDQEDPSDLLKTLQSDSATVQNALRLKCQLLSEIPHYLSFALASHGQTPAADQVLAIIQSTQLLVEQLAIEPGSLQPETLTNAIETLGTLTAELNTKRTRLLGQLQTQMQKDATTSGPASDAQQWEEIRRLLVVPFASQPGDPIESAVARGRLIERLRLTVPTSKDARTPASKTGETEEFPQLRQLAQHFILLRNGRHPDLEPLSAEQVGFELGKSWRQAYLWIAQGSYQTVDRNWLMQVDVASRLFDGLSSPTSQSTSAYELRRRQLVDFFLWHAQRAMEDFWAALETNAEPYFAIVSQQYLRLAAQHDTASLRGGEIKQFSDRLTQLRSVANQVQLEGSPSQMRLVEQLSLPIKFRIDYPPATPLGQAAFHVMTDSTDIGLTQAQTQGTASEELSFTVTRNARAATTAIDARLFFRGHVSRANFPVQVIDDEAGPTTLYERKQFVDAKFSIRRDRNEQSDVKTLFVLDCSSSMSQQNRMTILKQVLRRFARGVARNALNVGVRVFGDQVVWTEGDPAAEQQARLDTRLVMPIQPFDPDQFEAVVAGLQPVGSTPLFQALIEARKDFEKVKEGPKRIIVISDGADNWASVGRRPNLQDLIEAYTDSDIEINAIGFGVGDADYSALENIAASGGGMSGRTDQPEALFKYVTGLQGAVYFTVSGDGVRLPKEPALVTTKEASLSLSPGNYVVEVKDHAGQRVAAPFPLLVRPGEAHPLFYSRGVIRYVPLQGQATVVEESSGIALSILEAQKVKGDLRLTAAVFKPDVPAWRPEAISLRVRPDKSDTAFVIHHLPPNAPDHYVGAWTFWAKDWPTEAKRAEVTLQWTDQASDIKPLSVEWGQQPIAGSLPQGSRLLYRPFELRTIGSDRKQSVKVKLVFPPPFRAEMDGWSMTFDRAIEQARQTYNKAEGVFTGVYALDGQVAPSTLRIHPQLRQSSERSLKLIVDVSTPLIEVSSTLDDSLKF